MHIYHEMAGSLELWHYRVIIKKINLYLLNVILLPDQSSWDLGTFI